MTESIYQPVWDALKLHGQTEILADPRHHKRIKKAIIKRKDIDTAYKLQVSEENKKAILEFWVDTKEPNKLNIKLTKVTGWRNL